MKIFVYVALTLAGLALASCRFPNGVAENHFTVVATPGMSAPILLNEATGESWRLTDSGWQPIAIPLKEHAVESGEIKNEPEALGNRVIKTTNGDDFVITPEMQKGIDEARARREGR